MRLSKGRVGFKGTIFKVFLSEFWGGKEERKRKDGGRCISVPNDQQSKMSGDFISPSVKFCEIKS